MRSRRTAGSREVATGIWNRVGCAAGGALHEGTRAAFPSRTGQALSLPTVRRAYITNAPNHRRRYAANRTLASGGTRRSVGALLAAPLHPNCDSTIDWRLTRPITTGHRTP